MFLNFAPDEMKKAQYDRFGYYDPAISAILEVVENNTFAKIHHPNIFLGCIFAKPGREKRLGKRRRNKFGW